MRACFFLLGLVAPPLHADDHAGAQALVDRAIEAHGGLERLTRLPARTWKGKGTFHTGHGDLALAVHGARQGVDQMVLCLESTDPASPFSRTLVLDGTHGWVRMNGRLEELLGGALNEERERGYTNSLTALFPLRDPQFVLSELPAIEVEGKPAVGVLVRRPGRREARLYFDRETALLVKREAVVHDLEHDGKGVIEEVLFGGYRDLGGVRQAGRIKVYWDGRLRYDLELVEQARKPKLDASVFARP